MRSIREHTVLRHCSAGRRGRAKSAPVGAEFTFRPSKGNPRHFFARAVKGPEDSESSPETNQEREPQALARMKDGMAQESILSQSCLSTFRVRLVSVADQRTDRITSNARPISTPVQCFCNAVI
jgi:hypothetical protein